MGAALGTPGHGKEAGRARRALKRARGGFQGRAQARGGRALPQESGACFRPNAEAGIPEKAREMLLRALDAGGSAPCGLSENAPSPGGAGLRLLAEKGAAAAQAFAVFGGKFAGERIVPLHLHAGLLRGERNGGAQGEKRIPLAAARPAARRDFRKAAGGKTVAVGPGAAAQRYVPAPTAAPQQPIKPQLPPGMRPARRTISGSPVSSSAAPPLAW